MVLTERRGLKCGLLISEIVAQLCLLSVDVSGTSPAGPLGTCCLPSFTAQSVICLSQGRQCRLRPEREPPLSFFFSFFPESNHRSILWIAYFRQTLSRISLFSFESLPFS